VRTPREAPEAIAAAAKSGNLGEVLRLARQAQDITQEQLSQLCQCNQSTISRIERGTYIPDINTLRTIARKLMLPLVLVGLADHAPASDIAPPSEDPVKRREFLQAAAVLAGSAMTHIAPDDSLLAIHTITNAQRRLDATTPSRNLAESVVSHLRLATSKHSSAHGPRDQHNVAAAISEIAGYAAWLHWDMHDLGSARRYYNTAIRAAQSTEDSTLHAYMLGSLATLAVYEGDAVEGLALLRRAAVQVEPNPSATAIAWLSSLEAVAQADSNNARRAWEALDKADQAVDQIATQDPPLWPWVFQFDHAKVARYRLTCAARLGRPEIAYTAAHEVSDFLESGHAKQRALAQLDLASAHLYARELDEAFNIASRAVQLGCQAQSGRVIDAARQFRRKFTGSPASPVVQDFDRLLYGSSL
jgi:transcriptional regulator with XRE-family HTH domain